MAISDRLNKLTTDITNAYTSIENKGGTIPANKNTNNLSTAIDSIEVIEQATAEGESLSLTNTKAMPYNDYVVKGKSEQETGISLNIFKTIPNQTIQDVVLTKNSDGSYNLNGLAADNGNFELAWQTLEAGTYTLQCKYDGTLPTNAVPRVQIYSAGASLDVRINNADSNTYVQTFTLANTATDIRFRVRVVSGFNYQNLKLYPLLVSGTYTSSTIPNYEPYGEKPSPSNPSEIHSVADDVNLLENMTIYNSNHYISPLLKLNPGTYTFNYTGDSAPGIYIRKNDGSNPTNGTVVDQKYTANNITFSISETGNYYIHLYSSTIWEQLTMNNPKLRKGTVATPYSPYNQGTVTIKQRGENEFNVQDITLNKYLEYNTGNIYDSSASNISGYIPVTANKSYLFNWNYQSLVSTGNRAICFYDNNKNYVSGEIYSSTDKIYKLNPQINGFYRITLDKNYQDMQFLLADDYTIQTEPLRSLPNGVKDTIEADGIHRRVGRIVLDGSEDKGWHYEELNYGNNFYINIPDAKGGNETPILSNYFKYYENGKLEPDYSCRISSSKNLNLRHQDFTNIADFKTWLSNNPVEVIYELETEVIEPLTQNQAITMLDIIKTGSYEGTTNIDTDEDVKPTMKVGYYKKG